MPKVKAGLLQGKCHHIDLKLFHSSRDAGEHGVLVWSFMAVLCILMTHSHI